MSIHEEFLLAFGMGSGDMIDYDGDAWKGFSAGLDCRAATPQGPANGTLLVTLDSALAAIEHLNQSNSPGREVDARRMLVDATPPAPTPAAAEGQAEAVAWAVESNIGTGVRAFVKFCTEEGEADRFAARHQAAYAGAERVKVPLYRAAPLPRQAAVQD